MAREISWTKILVILGLCQEDSECGFYLRQTQQFGWTKNGLIHQIENRTYKKTRLNQTSFDQALPEHMTFWSMKGNQPPIALLAMVSTDANRRSHL
jgi:hypothetical protein